MNQGAKVRAASGFTIIELLLAMTFVSLLLMAIALTVMQIAATYNKGLTLRAVDEAGRIVTTDIKRAISSDRPLDIGEAGEGGAHFRLQYNEAPGAAALADGGRLCVGSYSYLWNKGEALSRGVEVNRYQDSTKTIRLVKVRDSGALLCNDLTRQATLADATELLEGDRQLALHSFKIEPFADNAGLQQAIYGITLEIGTSDQSELISTIDTRCKSPGDGVSQNEFCAVNKFEFTARAGNRGESVQ